MMRLILMFALLLGLFANQLEAQVSDVAGIGERVLIEDEVLSRWENISRLAVGPRAEAFIAEGEQILTRYRELQMLELAQEPGRNLKEINIEISKLKLTMIHLLHSIEEARLFDMNREQLGELKGEYLSEREELLRQRAEVRERVLSKGEEFLQTYRRDKGMQRFSQRDVVAKLCLQLAELYYSKSEEEYFVKSDTLLARLERGLPPGTEPVKDFDDAVLKYQRIIDEFPFSDYMDDALYNVAYIRENSDDPIEVEESRRLYEQLTRDFAGSNYAPEAWMRLGEYWFRKDGENALREAVAHYERILDYPDYPSQEKALYKLGWCHYRLLEHATSVRYFAEAAKFAVRRTTEAGASGDLLDESIAYIAVNYADPEWEDASVGALTAMLRADDEMRNGFGFDLMNRYGDLFRSETQDFERAVAAYDSLLVLYPDHPQAPFIQEKVILCYAPGALANPEMAYQEKNQLFEAYRQDGAWNSENNEGVNRLLEQHLEENVSIAMSRAYRTDTREDFEEFVSQSRRYLDSFPEDSSAFSIHWNMSKTMEKELEDWEAAYEEYLTISHSYPGRDLQDAAYNAIVISQILVDQEALEAEAEPVEGEPAAAGLTEMERLKLAALENFVELFPEDGRAPEYKLVAGKLYYGHGDFLAANEHFDSLIESWSEAPQVAEAFQLKLEGLFALGAFQEAEQIARTIQGMGLGEDVAERARTRQAESVYAFAEQLKGSEDHLAAAEEFRRMALDVPDAPFADASLFDAASEFTLAAEHQQAADTYLYLAATYPESDYADRSISLAGFLYLNELNDFRQAAEVFEQLATSYPDSEYTKAGVSNAAYCYEKVEDWPSTIRMNSLYVDRFPTAEDAALILFNNAGLYLKLDDVDSANRIYADFATRYPDDPRTVQAFVERAEYFAERLDDAAARGEYLRAVERNRALQRKGLAGNALYASRALRKVINWRYEEYEQLEMRLPLAQRDRDLAAKKQFRDSLLEELGELIQLGTGDVFYGRYMIAAVQEEFARCYREQEREPYRRAEDKVRTEVEIQDAAHELAQAAAMSYVNTTRELEGAVESLRRQQRELEQKRQDLEEYILAQETQALPVPDDSLTQRLARTRAADLIDSSLAESSLWTTRSREKVPEVLLASLAEYEKRMDYALELRSQYRDDPFLRYADIDRNLLSGAALATFRAVVQAYHEGLAQISEVGLGRLWKPRVEQRIQARLFQLPDAYQAFRNETYASFDNKVSTFLEVVDMGEDYVDDEGLVEEDHGNDVLDMADFNQGYAVNSLLIYEQMLGVLEENEFLGTLGDVLSDSLAVKALAFNREMRDRRGGLDSLKELYWHRFEQSASYVHRDAHSTLDDASYFLGQTADVALTSAEPVVSRINPGSLPARRMLFVLAKVDPARFGSRFGLNEETIQLGTETDWLSMDSYIQGFVDIEFDDGGWSLSSPGTAALDGLVDGARSIWRDRPPADATQQDVPADTLLLALDDSLLANAIALLDTIETDAGDRLARVLMAGSAEPAGSGADTSFFRHAFELDGSPVGAGLTLAADDVFFLFFNGEYIDEQLAEENEDGVRHVHQYNLDEFLLPGRNVIAVEVQDRDGSGGGLALSFEARRIAELTEEIFEEQLQEELIRQRREEFLKQVGRVYGKNRVD